MNFNCSKELLQKHAEYVQNLIDKKDFPAMTSGCEYDISRECCKSANWVGVHYHQSLKDAVAGKLGLSIGDSNGYSANGRPLTIGTCAEQHAANAVLKSCTPDETIPFDVTNLLFSPAIRPKGKKVKDPCGNCNTIFS